MKRITGLFDDYDHAEAAVNALRKNGLTEEHIGVLAHQSHKKEHQKAKAVGRGAAVGAGAGVVLGIAAAAIPGVGPFITAGVLTSWMGATAGSMAAGAAAGGASGALAGLLQERADFPKTEAEDVARKVHEGGILVTVDVPKGVDEESVLTALANQGAYVHRTKMN